MISGTQFIMSDRSSRISRPHGNHQKTKRLNLYICLIIIVSTQAQPVYRRRKRSKYEIVHDILSNCQNGAKKTWVMYRANLSYDLTASYLNELIKNGLIEARDGFYYTTEKGKQLLELLDKWLKVNSESIALLNQIKQYLPDQEDEQTAKPQN